MIPSLPDLVVATTSRYRLALLDRLGVVYRSVAHKLDERAAEAEAASPEEIACTLARGKAESVAGEYPGALVLASDQVVDFAGELLHKPETVENAVEQLLRLSGKKHRLLTAVALRRPDGTWDESLDVHEMTMRTLYEEQIRAYVDRERPLDCAGSYKIEGLGIALFESIRGDDYTGIIGLPLTDVVAMLARAGIDVLSA
jgi:septum formation protein